MVRVQFMIFNSSKIALVTGTYLFTGKDSGKHLACSILRLFVLYFMKTIQNTYLMVRNTYHVF